MPATHTFITAARACATPLRHAALALAMAGTNLLATAPARADTPIVFSQTGQVTVTLVANAGGFDHLLEFALVGGNGSWSAYVPEPSGAWLSATENGSPLVLVGDPDGPRAAAVVGEVWGTFTQIEAGQEIAVRLTNIYTERLGGLPADLHGTIHSQVFSGISSAANTEFSGGSVVGGTPGSPNPDAPLPMGFTEVSFLSATEIRVGFTDLDVNRPDPFQNVVLLFTLTPAVPEPGAGAMLLAGLGVVVMLRRRRAR